MKGSEAALLRDRDDEGASAMAATKVQVRHAGFISPQHASLTLANYKVTSPYNLAGAERAP